MAQLERFYTDAIVYTNGDGTFRNINLPTISAGTALLVTSLYINSNKAYVGNVVQLQVTNGGTDYAFFQTATGQLTTNPGAIITPDAPVVLLSSDVLSMQFSNFEGAGPTVTVTVFYRLIPNQTGTNPITFGVLRGETVGATITLAFPSVPANNITFIKSLYVLNTDFTQSYTLKFDTSILKTYSIVEDTSTVMIGKSDELFRISGQNIVITCTSTTTKYYLSYYYDPLYTA